jgi:hypothetical protein
LIVIVQSEKKLKGREKKLKKSFEVATTLGEIAVGITATTAVAIATGVVGVVSSLPLLPFNIIYIKKQNKFFLRQVGDSNCFRSFRSICYQACY